MGQILRMTEKEKSKPSGIIELYRCIQSEGSRSGRPTIAIRTTGCTHRCYFGEGGWCDSWYTSIHPEKSIFSFNDVIKIYDENPYIKEMMLTGGSPTMWPKLVNELTHFANERGIVITMETEGSHFIETDYPIGLISLSPKFSNSVPKIGIPMPNGELTDEKLIIKHNNLRLNKEAIKQTLAYHTDYHFKPVCNPVEMMYTWKEIEEFRIEMGIPKSKTWLMPPGSTRNELIRVYPMVFNFCTKNGYNFTGREHIIAFDEKRGV
jgi:7-carboxy-7-deazaguanine synthase